MAPAGFMKRMMACLSTMATPCSIWVRARSAREFSVSEIGAGME